MLALLLLFFQVTPSQGYTPIAKEVKISLSLESATFRQVLREIERQSELHFFYSADLVNNNQKVNVSLNGSLEHILEALFAGKGITWQIKGRQIVLDRERTTSQRNTYIDNRLGIPSTFPEVHSPAIYLPVSEIPISEITVKGRAKDERGESLPGVSILIKGSQHGTTSDNEGRFSISVPNSEAVLVFSFVGYLTQEIVVGTKSTIDVDLKVDEKSLEEVVVVGYGTVNRRDLTGSVSSVNAKQLKDIPINSVEQALTGRLAGVQVTTSEGAPGADVKIRVRGGGSVTQDNSPLYIIDGIQVEEGLMGLSPQDIQSIDVLKDASATAIYGARGANGVIIVTTKGGKEMKTSVTYNGFIGFRNVVRKLDVMKPYDFVVYQYERSRGTADTTNFDRQYGASWDTLGVYKNTPFVDWQEEVFGRTAAMQTHNLSIAGGSKATKYSLSFTRNREEGVMLNSGFQRNLVNFKFDHTAPQLFQVGFNVRYNDQAVHGGGVSSEGMSYTNKLRHSVKYRPFLADPSMSVEDPDDEYYNETNVGNALGIINPIQVIHSEYNKDAMRIFNFGSYLHLNLLKQLSFRTTAGINYNIRQVRSFLDIHASEVRQFGGGMPLGGIRTLDKTSFNVSNVLTYHNSFSGKHSINFLLGQEIYQTRQNEINNQQRYFPIGVTAEKALAQLSLGTSYPLFPKTIELESRILSFFSRINYSFDNKYLATFTVRSDGSTKFAKNQRWGYFPSGSLAWRLSEEEFLKNSGLISDLKLRASYGEAGNNRVEDFLYTPIFSSSSAPYGLNEQLRTGYNVLTLANPNLKWEKTISKNLGIDISLKNHRVQMSVDAYQNDTRDLLVNIPIPSSTGYRSQLQNIGSTRNQGLEFQLSTILADRKNFEWNTNFNISFNRNKVISLATGQDGYHINSGWGITGSPPDFIIQAGQSIGLMVGYVTDGFYGLDDFNYDADSKSYTLKEGVPVNTLFTASPGSIKFRDVNGDGKIDPDNDRTIIGNATPKFTGGMNHQFIYKNLDLSIFLNFVYGNQIMNANRIEFTNAYSGSSNMLSEAVNRWRAIDEHGNLLLNGLRGEAPEVLEALNKDATTWRPVSGANAFVLHSWAIENGSFLRIDNVTLGYTVPSKITSRVKVGNLRFYGTVNNLAILTGYSGYDPEVNTRRATPVTPGVDYSAYPRSRAIIFGLNLKF